ncbi:MAG: nucleotidyltransferase family protein, partial [Myxococcota bacterium]
MDLMRFATASEESLRQELIAIIASSSTLTRTLEQLREMALPDAWIVSGAIYNQVWNVLTGRPEMYGVKDIDLFYFDPDTSWEAEDVVIQRGAKLFAPEPYVEIRNQARVHLWFKDKFGLDYAPLRSSSEGVDRFASTTHCVGVRLMDTLEASVEIYAPFGLRDIFTLHLKPNTVLDNRDVYEQKAASQKQRWPELKVAPWPEQ